MTTTTVHGCCTMCWPNGPGWCPCLATFYTAYSTGRVSRRLSQKQKLFKFRSSKNVHIWDNFTVLCPAQNLRELDNYLLHTHVPAHSHGHSGHIGVGTRNLVARLGFTRRFPSFERFDNFSIRKSRVLTTKWWMLHMTDRKPTETFKSSLKSTGLCFKYSRFHLREIVELVSTSSQNTTISGCGVEELTFSASNGCPGASGLHRTKLLRTATTKWDYLINNRSPWKQYCLLQKEWR